MSMIFYNANLSPFTARVRIQIRAKGIEDKVKITDRPADDAAYKAINPTGRVPSLDTGQGFILPESETISEFIEDAFPNPSMRGEGDVGKAKVRLIARIADTYIMPPMGELFGQLRERNQAKIDDCVEDLKDGVSYLETYIEGPNYAVENRLTLADCALAPALLSMTAILPLIGQQPCLGSTKLQGFFGNLMNDKYVGQSLGELNAAAAVWLREQTA